MQVLVIPILKRVQLYQCHALTVHVPFFTRNVQLHTYAVHVICVFLIRFLCSLLMLTLSEKPITCLDFLRHFMLNKSYFHKIDFSGFNEHF